MSLINRLKATNLIKTGNFTLKSGLQSNLYFDFKGLNSYPKLVAEISYELSKLMISNDVCVAGVPIGGMSYAFMVSYIKNIPMVLIREEKKTYGTCQQIEGNTFGKDLVLIEDVITTGGSVISTLEILKKNGINVKQVLCILDRERGGVQKISEMGYHVTSLLKMSDIVNQQVLTRQIKINSAITQKLIDIINTKKTNLIASLDIINSYELLDQLKLVGEHICAVKIHYDILDCPHNEFYTELNKLKLEKNFLVIEDRKLSDIPFISIKQRFNYLCADIVTVHGVCGEKLIEELNKTNIGILLVHQLSIEGNLIDTIYSNKVKDMATKFNNVVGFVSQENVLPDYLTFTPGINLDTKTDNKGQTYRNVDECSSDVYIVGRGLYESDDIATAANLYKTMAFSKWILK